MISSILKIKFKLIPILIFTLLIYGCETVKTYYVEKENVPKEGVVRIAGVFLKSGEVVNVKYKNAKLVLNGDSKGISYDINESKQSVIPIDNIAK